jgi:hypothetical protein
MIFNNNSWGVMTTARQVESMIGGNTIGADVIPMPESFDLSLTTHRVGKG